MTLWGIADDDTWLDTFPVTRKDAPLLFDVALQAKPAFWSVVGTTSPSPSASRTATPTPTPTLTTPPPTSSTPPPSSSTGPPPAGACQVTYTIINQWPGGFQSEVRITNTSTSTVNGWTLRWSFANGQQITQIWNATQVTSGTTVAATNLSYNGTITTSASVTFGFLGNWSTANAKPAAFTLNNTSCTVA